MKINPILLENAFLLVQQTLDKQDSPDFTKNRWRRALEKAHQRILEQPYFAWQPEQLTIVSIPKAKSKKKEDQHGCRFYQANSEKCCRLDKVGYCQAFFEGFPCWHRAAFLLLSIYFDKLGEIEANDSQKSSIAVPSVNQS